MRVSWGRKPNNSQTVDTKLEDNLQGSLFSFHLDGPGDWTWISRLGSSFFIWRAISLDLTLVFLMHWISGKWVSQGRFMSTRNSSYFGHNMIPSYKMTLLQHAASQQLSRWREKRHEPVATLQGNLWSSPLIASTNVDIKNCVQSSQYLC